MVARLAQRFWCMQRVQLCVHAVSSGCKGLWAPNSPAMTSAALPVTEMQQAFVCADVPPAAAVSHLSSRNMHQSMGHWFMSGGLPSVRPLSYLCSTAGCSSSAVQLDGIAGDHGDVGAVVPDQDLASDAESEVFEEADAVMQPDLLHTEVPLQVKAAASHVSWR